jgi:N-acetylglucosaminyldiphosphoundecaprenol N-acetyl-beta-D-mannosaminyltransferase
MLNIISKAGSDKIGVNKGIITFLNPYSYLLLRYRKDLLKEFDVIYIDGEWLCKFLRWFRIINLKRRSFDNSSLAPVVFKNAEREHLKVSIVGTDKDSIYKFVEYMKLSYPKINIVYSRDGYFNDESEIDEAILNVKNRNSDILIVGMGAIKQEEFLVKVKNTGWNGVGFTCGGFLHQTANKGHEYYPTWIDRYNLRYLYRMWDEPKLIKRYTLDYITFVLLFLRDTKISRVDE